MTKKFFISLLPLTLFLVLGTNFVLAQPTTGSNPPPISGSNPPPVTGSNPSNCNATFCLENPFKVGDTLFQLLEKVVNDIVLPIGGMLAVLAFIYSGFLYVTAQGKPAALEKANKALLYTAIGTAVLLGSWALANVIRGTINQLI